MRATYDGDDIKWGEPVVHEASAVMKPAPRIVSNPEDQARKALLSVLDTFAGHTRFYELVTEMAILHAQKNQDYAAAGDPFSNFRQCEAAGIPAFDGCLTRLSDKYSRVMNLRKKEKNSQVRAVQDETITDTLKDMAVYALIAIALHEEEEGRII